MSELDGIEDGEDLGEDAGRRGVETGLTPAASGTCLSCGAPSAGAFCAQCGQKNDDLRRSLMLLARNFAEDTFSFDSRMWRTLGLLAAAPGLVPKNYAHGRRSQFTPPVRLFLVVSFLFFLLLGVTRTLFVAIEITDSDKNSFAGVTLFEDAEADAASPDAAGETVDCNLMARLRFFVRARAVEGDIDRWLQCVEEFRSATAAPGAAAAAAPTPSANGAGSHTEEAPAILKRLAEGVGAALENPGSFNAAFNSWLPRVMFLMAPVAALILGIFIRGRDALFFDHMVLSLYSHAVGFAVVSLAVVAMQIGAPLAGAAAAAAIFVYFVLAIKQAYGRSWIKTLYAGAMTGLLYLIILVTVVILITIRIILQS